MARGDTVSGISSVTSGSTLSLQPGAGIEWKIHNVHYGGDVDFQFSDNGVAYITIDSFTGPGSQQDLKWNCTNTYFYKIKNTGASTIYIGYDGAVRK